VIKRPFKFKFAIIKSILIKVIIVYIAVDIKNKTAISRLLKEVLIIVILLIESIVIIFITVKKNRYTLRFNKSNLN